MNSILYDCSICIFKLSVGHNSILLGPNLSYDQYTVSKDLLEFPSCVLSRRCDIERF